MAPIRSHVVTGAGRGIGRAVVERLLAGGDAVVALDRDAQALAWVGDHPAGGRAIPLAGDGTTGKVTEQAADLAQEAGVLTGWVNNAAVFRDASVHTDDLDVVLGLVTANLALALAGCTTAVRRFVAAGSTGSIVNVSSHQARQAVPGCTPYVTAKAAIEGLTRALAVEYGPRGIRVNAVAPGSVATERYADLLATQPDGERSASSARCASCTRSAGWRARTRSPTPSPTSCPTPRASSPAPRSRWTAAAPSWRTTRRADPAGREARARHGRRRAPGLTTGS